MFLTTMSMGNQTMQSHPWTTLWDIHKPWTACVCVHSAIFVCLFGFLTSSSTTRLYRGPAPRQSVWQFTCCHTWDRAGRPWLLSQPAFCNKLTCQVACWRKDWTHCRSGSHALKKTCSHNTKKVSLLQYYTITINRKRREVIKQRTNSTQTLWESTADPCPTFVTNGLWNYSYKLFLFPQSFPSYKYLLWFPQNFNTIYSTGK